ncbi:MAG: secretin N-terminal domain-containing protein [Candidatus Omnitrophota bacterium]
MMRKTFFFTLLFTCALATGLNNLAAEEAVPQVFLPKDLKMPQGISIAGKGERISVSLRNIDIIEALKFFSMRSGLNIIPTQKVAGRVTLTVEDVPVMDVFDIMLRSNSLAYDRKGEIFNVMTEDEYRMLYGKNFSDTRQVKVFRLKYAVPEQAFAMLDALKSEIGRLLVEVESGAIMLIDTPEKLTEAEKALAALEQKNTVKVFDLKYALAKDVEEQLKNQLDLKKVGIVKSDSRTNQIIVQALPERMPNIEELIARLDKKTKAVLIDTKILKIKLSDREDRGIQWEGLFNIAKQYGMAYLGSYPFSAIQSATSAFKTRSDLLSSLGGQVGSYPFSGTTSNLSASTKTVLGEKMHIGVVDSKRDFDVVIDYLSTLGKSKIMASPSISVVNNQEAKIHIGERRAYVTTTTTTGSSSVTVAEEITYVDVGIRLSVIPTINDDGYVTIKVKPEISSVVDNIVTSSNNTIPILDTSTAETTVIAKDKSTIIIGGLGREEVTSSSKQVPFFGNLPLIGFLFKSKTQTNERFELVIMLTPIIFEGDKFITAEEADKFPVKSPKKFDVFKPEGKLNQGTAAAVLLKDEFMSKSFKPYSTSISPEPETGVMPASSIKDNVNLQNFKLGTMGGSETRVDKTAGKGFRAYN